MKILWVKPVLPFPPHQGTRRVTLQLLQHLAREHTICLFARLATRDEAEQVAQLQAAVPGLEVVAPLAPNRRSLAHRIWYRGVTRRAGQRGIPPVEAYATLPELMRAFQAARERFQPELVVAEYWYSAQYLEHAADLPGVLFAHDIESAAREGQGGTHQEASRAGWQAHEAARESRALRHAAFTWFLTQADRDQAVDRFGVNPEHTDIMPYGIDLSGALGTRRAEDPVEDPDQVLLFGSFAADFNRDALEYTLDAIWPRLRARRPGTRLVVAGGGLSSSLANRARAEGMEVIGEVADVRSTLLRAAVVLIPLRYGGGLRIRLLESLALERAVVGTSVGVLGMGPGADRDVVAADDPEVLAGQVASLLDDPQRRRELGTRGRVWVQAHHGLEAAERTQSARIADVQRRLVERRPAPGN